MELLIVFIIVTILSSIMKSFQGARKSPARPPASERQEDYFPTEYRVEMQQPVLKKRSEQKKRPASGPSSASAPAPAAFSTARLPEEGMRRVEAQREDSRRMQQQLVELLGSEKIALGIVASEVLSPPRARRPHYRR